MLAFPLRQTFRDRPSVLLSFGARALHHGRTGPLSPAGTLLRPHLGAPRIPILGHVPGAVSRNALGRNKFHSTPRREGFPLVGLLGVLKASASFELLRTASRIAFTFIPPFLIGKKKAHMMKNNPAFHAKMTPEQRAAALKRIHGWTRVIQLILLFPCVVFWATLLASLERTPLTGRWRTILLSPEEEDDIAEQLVGEGWYKAVNQVLESEGQPSFIPPTDWRYQWVRDTFQRLVAILPTLENEKEQAPDWIETGEDGLPLPPPACHPLKPRPRAADMIVRHWCEIVKGKKVPSKPRDPDNFSLLLVESPTDSNAFSYGFWPNGGSGVVVYSGFLDDIFAKIPLEWETPPDERSWLSKVLGTSPPPLARPIITEEHTTDLAVLLAHELSHLILAHHLETLSASTVVVPGTIAILADLVRAVIFPITMFFGPFVNDAVAHMGSIGSGELKRMGEWCTTAKQEIEADVVSARILAYAGFDARDAIKFWENRQDHGAECNMVEKERREFNVQHISGTGHPENAKRIEVLRQELERWEEARRTAASGH